MKQPSLLGECVAEFLGTMVLILFGTGVVAMTLLFGTGVPGEIVKGGWTNITLGWGRDYADVCPIKGVFLGGGHHRMTVSVDVAPLDEEISPHA